MFGERTKFLFLSVMMALSTNVAAHAHSIPMAKPQSAGPQKLPQLVYSVWAKLQADKRFSSMFVQLNMSKGSITLLFTIWGAKKFRAWQIVEVYPG